jgi:DNA-binding GntR family transcriptional regulator
MHKLDHAVAEVAAAYQKGTIEDILKKKDVFYAVLVDGAGNDIVRSLLQMMHARISLLRRVSLSKSERLAASIKEIRAILKAAKGRDAKVTAEACALHVQRAADTALASMEQDGNSSIDNRTE